MATIHLKPGRERSLELRHPWIFSGAIERVRGDVRSGDSVDVLGAQGQWLARGTWSEQSQIRVRVWTWQADEAIDEDLIQRRVTRALAGRAHLRAAQDTSAHRLIFSESDGLPGVVVDRYDDYLAVQLSTVGAAARAETIVAALVAAEHPRGVLRRVDREAMAHEGLTLDEGVLWGDLPADGITYQEHGVRFRVDLRGGQKTGAFLDQRENRRRVAAYCAEAAVLSGFCYTGGFELPAALAGARSVVGIDSSAEALRLAEANAALNGLADRIQWLEGNVFSELRRYRAEGAQFDVVILDPPKFVQSRAQLERGCRGYKDINLLAMQLLRPGGILATFTCSGLVSADLFQKVVFGAAIDARRDVQIIERLAQAADHPVLLSFPEAAYLSGLICRVW